MPINSRQKGARGERELAAELRRHGFEARRGQQFSGGKDSPDVCAEIPGLHIECKRVEKLNLESAYQQATGDAGGKTPVVMHRKNRGKWLVTIALDDFVTMIPSPSPSVGNVAGLTFEERKYLLTLSNASFNAECFVKE
jgi:hypothetical protein